MSGPVLERGLQALALLVVLVFVASGCGGDATGGESASRSSYISRADVICRDLHRDFRALRQPSNLSELRDEASHASATLSSSLDRLRALRPPHGDEAAINSWLGILQQGPSILDELARMHRFDAAKLDRLGSSAEHIESVADARARRYGMKDCARGELLTAFVSAGPH